MILHFLVLVWKYIICHSECSEESTLHLTCHSERSLPRYAWWKSRKHEAYRFFGRYTPSEWHTNTHLCHFEALAEKSTTHHACHSEPEGRENPLCILLVILSVACHAMRGENPGNIKPIDSSVVTLPLNDTLTPIFVILNIAKNPPHITLVKNSIDFLTKTII